MSPDTPDEHEEWSLNEKQRLKKMYSEMTNSPKYKDRTNDGIIEHISCKLRRVKSEIASELKILDLYDESRDGGRELKDDTRQIDTPPTATIIMKPPPELKKQPVGENQDLGYLLTKLLNNGSALTNAKIDDTNTKIDDLIAAVKENSTVVSAASKENSKFQQEGLDIQQETLAIRREGLAILREELAIVKEQYAVWKEKHTPS